MIYFIILYVISRAAKTGYPVFSWVVWEQGWSVVGLVSVQSSGQTLGPTRIDSWDFEVYKNLSAWVNPPIRALPEEWWCLCQPTATARFQTWVPIYCLLLFLRESCHFSDCFLICRRATMPPSQDYCEDQVTCWCPCSPGRLLGRDRIP